MILYLNYEWNTGNVCIYTDHGKEYRPCRSISAFLNSRCQMEGSTLQGRREAFAKIMSARKTYSDSNLYTTKRTVYAFWRLFQP